MALEPSKLQLFQIGKETTYGTAAAANKRLKSPVLSLGYNVLEEDEDGQAFMGPTGSIIGKEYATLNFSGKAAINDLLYFFAMHLCAPVITTPTDGVLTRRWTFNPTMAGENTFNSCTIEKGIAGDVSIISGCRINDMSLAFDPGKASVGFSAAGFGRKANDEQASFTATPTLIAPYSMSGKMFSVYLGTAYNDITTRIKPLQTTWDSKGRHTPVFSGDDTEPCFEATVENGFSPSIKLIVPKGSVSNGYLTDLRASTTKFIKIEVISAQIESVGMGPTIYYQRLELSMPFNFREPTRDDQQDTHCHAFLCKGVYDANFGGTCKAVIDTQLTAL